MALCLSVPLGLHSVKQSPHVLTKTTPLWSSQQSIISRSTILSRWRHLCYGRSKAFFVLEMVPRRRLRNNLQAYRRSGTGGDNGNGNGPGNLVINMAMAGVLAYLTFTGKLAWILDAVVSIWLFLVLLPFVGLVAYLWFAWRDIVKGNCPNCGNEFQVFEFTVKDGSQLCPYCSQPFRLERKQFVRDGPHFSSRTSSRQDFGGFGQPSSPNSRNEDSSVVDIEAEVLPD